MINMEDKKDQSVIDQSVIGFKEKLHYEKDGESIKFSINDILFTVYKKGMKYHLDVEYNGKKRAVGNYRMMEWAMVEAPYFWVMKNIGGY